MPARPLTLNINGKSHALSLGPRVTLLDALRESADLTGTRKGCDRGQCGACTALVDGRPIDASLTPAIMHQGAKITTIEGIAQGDTLVPIHAASLERDAFQCGYRTLGRLCPAAACIAEMRAGAVTPGVREQRSASAIGYPRTHAREPVPLRRMQQHIVAAVRATADA